MMKAFEKAKVVLLIFFCFCIAGCIESGVPSNGNEIDVTEKEKQIIFLSAEWIQTERLSKQNIKITWPDIMDRDVENYLVKRCELDGSKGEGNWRIVGKVPSDGSTGGPMVCFIDELPDDKIRQFAYVVDVEVRAGLGYSSKQSQPVLASNLMICIDPGHFAGVNQIEGEYTEGDAMLHLGRALSTELKEVYGINSCMTRADGTISLYGYSNEKLDGAHLSFRGRYAGEMECDLFVSLHTNANETNANGYPTCFQPVTINKPILILNTVACSSQTTLDIANAIGKKIAQRVQLPMPMSASYFRYRLQQRIEFYPSWWRKES